MTPDRHRPNEISIYELNDPHMSHRVKFRHLTVRPQVGPLFVIPSNQHPLYEVRQHLIDHGPLGPVESLPIKRHGDRWTREEKMHKMIVWLESTEQLPW